MHNFCSWLYLLFTLLCIPLNGQDKLSVEKAVENALTNNFQVRVARNNALVQQTNNTAGNAGLLPEVNLNFGQNFNINNTKQEFFSGDIRQGNNVNTSNLNANIQLGWTVFDGLRMFINRDRLAELQSIGELTLRFQMESTIAQVMSLFFQIEQQQKRIETIREAIRFSQERLQWVSVKFDAGTSSTLPVLQARVDINADSSMLIGQLQILKSLEIQLNQTMGLNPDASFEYIPSGSVQSPELTELMVGAQERNSWLQLAEKEIKLAELNIKSWQSNKYPTVDINAGYNFSRLQAEIGILKFNQNAGVLFGLTGRWNLFNGWNNKREIQVARLGLENNKLEKESAILEWKANLLNTYQQFTTAKSREKLEESNIVLSKENLNISSEKLKSGTITPIEVRQAQMNLIDAEFRKISASFDQKISFLNLQQLTGKLLQ